MKKCLREKCDVFFEPNKPKQVFCSDKCRVYYSRENKKIKLLDATKATNQIKPEEQPKTNFQIDTLKGIKFGNSEGMFGGKNTGRFLQDEACQWEETRTFSFMEILSKAKSGASKETILAMIYQSKLTPGQKSQILSHCK